MRWIALLLALLVITACGGGGSGTGGGNQNATISGRVLQVTTGGPANPAATVTSAGATTTTAAGDGSFTLSVPQGTTSLSVNTNTAQGTFTFNFPPASGDVVLGDLWVGPERITVRGRVINSSNNLPVQNALVSFAGQTDTTDADGFFSISGVAYSSANQTAFWGIHGLIRAPGYLTGDFILQGLTASNGILTIPQDLLLNPTDDTDPPPSPFNLWGRVSPAGQAEGTLVTLKQNGTALRTYTVGADQAYYFWVEPGTYTLTFAKNSLSAPEQTVTLNTQNEVIRRDVTLQ